MKLFIIGGKANVGKNTLAKYIKEYYDEKNQKSIITEYSKYAKLYAYEMVGYTKGKKKPRKLLQELGELARNSIDNNVFIERMQQDIIIYQKYYQNIIICDARLIPEITIMKTKYKDCFTIHLLGKKDESLDEVERNHITEVEFDNFNDFDYTLENTSLEKLKENIYSVLDDIESRNLR